jgi:hypothetical protein
MARASRQFDGFLAAASDVSDSNSADADDADAATDDGDNDDDDPVSALERMLDG